MAVDLKITDQDLPVLSAIAAQALQLLQDPNVTNSKIDELIRQDPSLTQRVLHTANSPFYSGKFQSQTIRDAVVRLGIRQLRNIIVVAATGELFNADDPFIHDLWDHATACALASHVLAETLHLPHAEESFIAGMLHDVGKLVIYKQHPHIYQPLLEQSKAEQICISKLEEENFKIFTHMSVGGLVARKWKLPESLAEVARFHHDTYREIPLNLTNVNLVCLVSLADVMVNMEGIGGMGGVYEDLGAMAFVKELNFPLEKLDAARKRFMELYLTQRPAAV